MKIFIMRHGQAEPQAATDAVRPLTQTGRNESCQAAAWLARQSAEIQQVLVSPYLRTVQTLMAVREILPLPQEKFMPELTPDGDAQWMCDYLKSSAQQGTAAVLLISHLPLVGYLVALLCPEEKSVTMSTSAIAHVELDSKIGTGTLIAQISPSQLMLPR